MPVKTLGFDELARNLQAYGEAGLEALEAGLEAGAGVMRDAVEQRAPMELGDRVHYPSAKKTGYVILAKVRRPGQLKQSITIQKVASTELANGSPIFKIGPGKGGFYGYFLEWGTRKMPKHPFMRPAYDGASDAAMTAAETVISKKLGAK